MNKLLLVAALLALFALASVPSVAAETQVEAYQPEGFVCDLCFFLVSWVEGKLASNQTEAWIIKEVDNICSIFPSILAYECQNLVAYYVPVVINKLENKYSSLTICSDLGLCSWLKAQRAQLAASSAAPAPFTGHLGCAQCMFFSTMTYSSTVGMNDPIKIGVKLATLCASINDMTAKHMCGQFISRPGVVQMLAARTTPSSMCSRLGDCHKRAEEEVAERRLKMMSYVMEHPLPLPSLDATTGPLAPSSTECQLCQWIFSAYESWLSDGQTEAEIALFLSQLCNFFGSYAPQCNQLVRVYVPKVIQNYVERTTPPILCTSIGFCSFPINTFQQQAAQSTVVKQL